jgi:hypothetical protein
MMDRRLLLLANRTCREASVYKAGRKPASFAPRSMVFTEGFNTCDLNDAKALLDELEV